MIEMLAQILEKMKDVTEAKKKFIKILFATIIIMRGKQTFTNLSRYSELSEKTYRRNYQEEFNFVQLNKEIIKQARSQGKIIAAMDATFIKKSGKHTYGIDKFFNSLNSRAELGLELSTIALIDLEQNTAYALSVRQTPANLALDDNKQDNGKTEDNEKTRMDFYCEYLKEIRPNFPQEVKYLAADGYYAKEKFLQATKDSNIYLVSKLREDANLQFVYDFKSKEKKRGAPRKYAGKVNLLEPAQLSFVKELEPNLKLYTAVVYWMNTREKIRISYLLDCRNPKKIGYCILFSTDIFLDAQDLVLFYRSRFQIEFLFRDSKQFTGLLDCQARSKEKLDFHFNSSFTAVNLAKAHLRLNDFSSPFVFSLDSFKRKSFNLFLLDSFIFNLDLDPNFIKNHPNWPKLCSFGLLAA